MPPITRRTFLASTAAAATIAPTLLTRAADAPSDTRKLNLALIGCGGYGMTDLQAALKIGGVEVVAVCDVDTEHLSTSADKVAETQTTRPRTFKLYQELLETPGLRAVIIATPPHWHALPFIAALDKGLDVYCEKPLAYDIRECRAMVEAAKNHPDRIVQIGFQRRHAAGFQQARDYVRSDAAGKILAVDAQINFKTNVLDATPQSPPPSLDWDLWCGPAPKIPYSPQVGHHNWRLERTTGHGHLVDWGIHLIDQVRWFLGESTPRAVEAAGGIYAFQGKITTPDTLNATFDFETCPVTWRHRIWGAAEYDPDVNNGIFFFGDKQTVFVTDDHWTVIPRGGASKGKAKGKSPADRQTHEAKSEPGPLHMAEFLQCVRSRKQPANSIEEAHFSTTTVKLATIAYETGTRVIWDRSAEQIVNNPEALKLLKRDYRPPYRHPSVV